MEFWVNFWTFPMGTAIKLICASQTTLLACILFYIKQCVQRYKIQKVIMSLFLNQWTQKINCTVRHNFISIIFAKTKFSFFVIEVWESVEKLAYPIIIEILFTFSSPEFHFILHIRNLFKVNFNLSILKRTNICSQKVSS